MRWSVCLGMAAAMAWALAGCGGGDEGGGKPQVALVMKSLANEFFKTMEEGAKAHQETLEDEYELIANGIKNEQDVSKQIELVDQMIAMGVDAIVLAPADSKALVPVCKDALTAGVSVVNIDNRLDREVLADQGVEIPFVGPDNRKGARLAGEYLAGRLEPGAAVAIIEGAPNAYNGIQRALGFEDAMEAAGMEIVARQSGYWEIDEANKVVSGIITEHPEIEGLLCANDSMALGAVAALKAAGRSDEVYVVGFDNISAAQELLKEGDLLCTVDQHAGQLAVFGIEYALEIVKTGQTPEDKETPVDLVTAADVE